jgi:RNA polymerase sigma-70 factor, ECF subfamily
MEFGRQADDLPVPVGEVSRISRADTAARLSDEITELYVLRRNVVFRRVWQLCRNVAIAEELVQEAFLRLFTHLMSGQTVENHLHWVFRVARNLALDNVRYRCRECPEPDALELSSESVPDLAPTPEDMLLDRERSAELWRLLTTLSGTQRECLFLRIRGVPYHEMARYLGISVAAVIHQTELAIEKLRRRARR